MSKFFLYLFLGFMALLIVCSFAEGQTIWPLWSGDPGARSQAYRDSVDNYMIGRIKDIMQWSSGDDYIYYKAINWFPTDSSETVWARIQPKNYSRPLLTKWFLRPENMVTDSLQIVGLMISKHSPLDSTRLSWTKADVLKPTITKITIDNAKARYQYKKQEVAKIRIKYKDKATKTKIKYKDKTGEYDKKLTVAEFEKLIWQVINGEAEILEKDNQAVKK